MIMYNAPSRYTQEKNMYCTYFHVKFMKFNTDTIQDTSNH